MKRRQLLLATASLSVAGMSGLSNAAADSSAQTDPVQVSDVTFELGDATASIGTAAIAYRENTLGFLGQNWTVTSGDHEVTLDQAVVAIGNVDEETYAQIREAGEQSVSQRSLSPTITALVEADLDPSAPVQAQFGPVTTDRGPVVDQVTMTGTVDSVTPENWEAFLMGESVELGSAQFDSVNVQRGSVAMTAENVVAQPSENALSVAADGGTVEAPSRTLEFQNLNTTFRPPEEGGEAQGQAIDGIRRLAANESLTLDAISTTLTESGVTVSNTMEALRNTRFEATVESVAENGETLVQDFSTTGTLSELLQVLSGQDVDGGAQTELPKEAIVSAPSTDESAPGEEGYYDYVFEVTGDLEELEPDEDSRHAVDEVIDAGDRVRVEGTVGPGDDRFAFSGELIEVDVPEEVQIEVRNR